MSDEWCPEHDGSHCAELRRLEQRIARLEAPERAILLDLIAELRTYARYTYTEYTLIENALDRAETRLKGLSDE